MGQPAPANLRSRADNRSVDGHEKELNELLIQLTAKLTPETAADLLQRDPAAFAAFAELLEQLDPTPAPLPPAATEILSQEPDPKRRFLDAINILGVSDPEQFGELAERLRASGLLKSVPSDYESRAGDSMALLFPVRIRGLEFLMGDIPFHITVKAFKPGDSAEQIEQLVDALGPVSLDASEVALSPEKITSAIGNEFYVLSVQPIPMVLVNLYEALKGLGWEYPVFKPHVTVDQSLWNEFSEKKLTSSDLELEVLPLELRQGRRVIKRWEPTLEKGAKGDWKSEGYTFKIHEPRQIKVGMSVKSAHPDTLDWTEHAVTAHDKSGKEVGRYSFQHFNTDYTDHTKPKMDDRLVVGNANTAPDHRRKGLATEAYRRIEQHTGVPLSDSPDSRSEDADRLWEQPKRPFGFALKKGANGDWKSEGYTISHKVSGPDHMQFDNGDHHEFDNVYEVTAHKDGKRVASAMLGHNKDNNYLMAYELGVSSGHQRKGIASAMYDHVEKLTGASAVPSPDRSDEAKRFWSARNRRAKLRKAAENDTSEVSSIVVRSGGKLLMGRRRDNGRWTLPGGHLNTGEDHLEGAIRELHEEAGILADRGHLKHLGTEDVTTPSGKSKRVHAFVYEHQGELPHPHNDPDQEVHGWEWVDANLPAEVRDNLHSPKNVALQRLGILQSELEKGASGDWKTEGYKLQHHIEVGRHEAMNIEWRNLHVVAHDRDGRKVGHARFQLHDDNKQPYAIPKNPFVEPEHRRKGIATAMYRLAEQVTGHRVYPDNSRTKAARGLWAQPNRPFGKKLSTLKKRLERAAEHLRKALHPEDWKSLLTSHAAEHEGVVSAKTHATSALPKHYANFLSQGPHDKAEITVNHSQTPPQLIDHSHGISNKLVHEVPTETGAKLRYQMRPYHKAQERGTEHFGTMPIGGWATLANKALYRAGKIGHLAEDVTGHHHSGVPVLVSKYAHGYADMAYAVDPSRHPNKEMQGRIASAGKLRHDPLQVHQIAAMDFLTGNLERHGRNLMTDTSKSPSGHHNLLAIDHDRSMQYTTPLHMMKEMKVAQPGEKVADHPHSYLHQSALLTASKNADMNAGKELFRRWWLEHGEKIGGELTNQTAHIKDAKVKEHVTRNFQERKALIDKWAKTPELHTKYNLFDEKMPLHAQVHEVVPRPKVSLTRSSGTGKVDPKVAAAATEKV